jgi:hypothetical protein
MKFVIPLFVFVILCSAGSVQAQCAGGQCSVARGPVRKAVVRVSVREGGRRALLPWRR